MSPRAAKICVEDGCPNFQVRASRCDTHARGYERRRSRRRRDEDRALHGGRWEELKAQVRREEPYCTCPGCGRCDDGPCGRPTAHVDHIVPRSEGGAPYARENLRGLCTSCHNARSAGDQARAT